MNSDNVSDSVNNGKIFESVSVKNEGGIVVTAVTSSFSSLDVEGRINELEGAEISILLLVVFADLVGEGGINDNGIEVLGFT